jgi:hypothetical protein
MRGTGGGRAHRAALYVPGERGINFHDFLVEPTVGIRISRADFWISLGDLADLLIVLLLTGSLQRERSEGNEGEER